MKVSRIIYTGHLCFLLLYTSLISVGQVLEIDDANTTKKTEEQATTSKTDATQATTTVSASDGLSAEDAAAKEWIAQKESSGSYTCLLYTSRCV